MPPQNSALPALIDIGTGLPPFITRTASALGTFWFLLPSPNWPVLKQPVTFFTFNDFAFHAEIDLLLFNSTIIGLVLLA